MIKTIAVLIFELMHLRTNAPSEQWTFGAMHLRNIAPSPAVCTVVRLSTSKITVKHLHSILTRHADRWV